MGGEQYVYSEGDAAWFNTFLARCEKTSKGMNGIILTEFTTSVVCAIAAGSVVEIDGALFHFDAETAVTGAVASGMNYIICSVTGTDANPYWSQDIFSTYDTVKAGLYTGSSKYVAECHYGATGVDYLAKYVYPERSRDLKRKMPIGDWNMHNSNSGSLTKNVAHGLGGNWKNIRLIGGAMRKDDDAQYYPLPRSSAGTNADAVIAYYDSTNIVLSARSGGTFDSVDYDSTSYNRGWITVWYVV